MVVNKFHIASASFVENVKLYLPGWFFTVKMLNCSLQACQKEKACHWLPISSNYAQHRKETNAFWEF